MTCTCLCCEAGAPCARELVLSPKDERKARDMWAAICPPGETYEPRAINLRPAPQETSFRREALEPTEAVRCRGCGGVYRLLAYLAAFLRDQRAPVPNCEACSTGGVA